MKSSTYNDLGRMDNFVVEYFYRDRQRYIPIHEAVYMFCIKVLLSWWFKLWRMSNYIAILCCDTCYCIEDKHYVWSLSHNELKLYFSVICCYNIFLIFSQNCIFYGDFRLTKLVYVKACIDARQCKVNQSYISWDRQI